MTPLAAYVLLFVAAGAAFIFVHLVAGKLIRPSRPDPEKETIYECGEPTIGSAWVQFDLRFYVVALLFVIFDVEVAFFFPWAEVFGKANNVAAAQGDLQGEAAQNYARQLYDLTPAAEGPYKAQRDKLLETTEVSAATVNKNRPAASGLAWLALGEILVFFGVLLVGFAYLWRRGDLQWVRSTLAERTTPPARAERQVLTGVGSGS